MKQDLWFVLVAVLLVAGFMALGFALGYVEFAQVADAILTPWSMFGLGVLFVAAILYTAMQSATPGTSAKEPLHADNSPYLSGRSVALIVALFIVAVGAGIAYTVFAVS